MDLAKLMFPADIHSRTSIIVAFAVSKSCYLGIFPEDVVCSKTKDYGAQLLSMCDVNRGVAEWLTGGDGMCQWKRLSSEGLQADIHSFKDCRRMDCGGRHHT
jgi:hypothetical protein